MISPLPFLFIYSIFFCQRDGANLAYTWYGLLTVLVFHNLHKDARMHFSILLACAIIDLYFSLCIVLYVFLCRYPSIHSTFLVLASHPPISIDHLLDLE